MPPIDPVHTETYKGYTISIYPDTDAENPREAYDNTATMICFHHKYKLGDKHDYKSPDEAVASICGISVEDISLIDADDDITFALNVAPIYWLPLYLYDHSGITMQTTPFSCKWDSGQVGIIYITKRKADEEWTINDNETQEDYDNRILGYLRSEVSVYNQYLTGNVYGYIATKEGTDNTDDSCFGFFGDYEKGALAEARGEIDAKLNG